MNLFGAGFRLKACFLISLMIVFVSSGSASQSQCITFGCDKPLIEQWIKGKSRQQIREIQTNLEQIGYSPRGIDGLVGKNTLVALKKLCVAQKGIAGLESALAGAADRMVTPEGMVTYVLQKNDLKSLKERVESAEKIDVGELADKAFDTRDELQSEVKALFGENSAKHAVYLQQILKNIREVQVYRISDKTIADFKLARTLPDELIEQVGAIKEQEFTTQEELQNKLKTAVEAFTEKYRALIPALIEKTTLYQVTQITIDRFKAEMVPEKVVKQLKTLKSEQFYTKEELVEKLQQILGDEGEAYVAEVVTKADRWYGYRLNKKSIASLRAKAPECLVVELGQLEGKIYFREKTFIEDLNRVIDTTVKKLNRNLLTIAEKLSETLKYELKLDDPSLQNLSQVPTEVMKSILFFKGKTYACEDRLIEELKKVISQTADDYQSRLIALAESKTTFHLKKSALSPKPAVTETVDPLALALVGGLEGQNFLNRRIFEQALDRQITTTAQQYAEAMKKKKSGASLVCLAEIEEAIAEDETAQGVLEALALIRKTQGEVCGQRLDQALDKAPGLLIKQAMLETPKIINMARQVRPFEAIAPAVWQSADSDCKQKGDKMVYGLYPAWLYPDSGRQPQQIDFNSLTNIGYWGMPFDENGNFPKNMVGDGQFILEARRFKTYVDLVVYSSNWKQWAETGDASGLKQDAIDRLNDKILALLNKEFKRRPMEFKLHNRLYGVTLFFDDLAQDGKYTEFIYALISNLRRKTSQSDSSLTLKVLLSLKDLQQGAFSSEVIKKMNSDTDFNMNGLIDQYLVLMAGTKGENKVLAELVLNQEDGEKIVNFRNKVVPIVAASVESRDRVIDYVDSYGGVGFAGVPEKGLFSREDLKLPTRGKGPFPTLAALGIPLGDLLEKLYVMSDSLCQYRSYLYSAWWGLVCFLVLYSVLCIALIAPRDFMHKHWLLTIFTLLITLLLSWYLYDVWWSDSKYQLVAFCVVVIGGGIYMFYFWGRKAKEKNYP